MGGCLTKKTEPQPFMPIEYIPGFGIIFGAKLRVQYPFIMQACEVWATFELMKQDDKKHEEFINWLVNVENILPYRIQRCIDCFESVSVDGHGLQIAKIIYRHMDVYDHSLKDTIEFLEKSNKGRERIIYNTLYNHACKYINNQLLAKIELTY
jgi:hypothetical protein